MKKSKFYFEEIKSLLILIIIFGALIFLGYTWYKKIVLLNIEKKHQQYQVHTIDIDNNYRIINDKYIILYKDSTLSEIYDFNGKNIYQGEIEFTDIYEGIDGKIYVYLSEEADYSNKVSVYRIDNKKEKLIKTLHIEGTNYIPIVSKNDSSYLLGFVNYKVLNEIDTSNSLFLLNQGEIDIDFSLLNDGNENIVLANNSRYLIISKDDRYGLYNIKDNKVIVDFDYEELTYDKNNYIAKKNNKYGIIDRNQKKIVDFDYDNIFSYDNSLLLVKDNKIILMDSSYNLIETTIKYDKDDTYLLYIVNNKFILKTNKKIYFINENGEADIKEDNYLEVSDLIYSYNNQSKIYSIYNDDLSLKYTIDLGDYDFNKYEKLFLVNNTLVLGNEKILFDFKTGEVINNYLDYNSTIKNIKLVFDGENKTIKIYENNKIKYNDTVVGNKDNFIHKMDNGKYYVVNEKEIVIIN